MFLASSHSPGISWFSNYFYKHLIEVLVLIYIPQEIIIIFVYGMALISFKYKRLFKRIEYVLIVVGFSIKW